MDALARMKGFRDADEMNEMVAAVPLGTEAQLRAFEQWKEADGSKAGLAILAAKPRVSPVEIELLRRQEEGLRQLSAQAAGRNFRAAAAALIEAAQVLERARRG